VRETSVAIIGCDYVTNGHLEAWRKVRRARVVAARAKEAYCKHLDLAEEDIVVIPNFKQEEGKELEPKRSGIFPDRSIATESTT
jgi:hypothetical protein